jgi:hypothetical protein
MTIALNSLLLLLLLLALLLLIHEVLTFNVSESVQ